MMNDELLNQATTTIINKCSIAPATHANDRKGKYTRKSNVLYEISFYHYLNVQIKEQDIRHFASIDSALRALLYHSL